MAKNLSKRNGNFQYRKGVPKDLRDLIGKREWTKSLKRYTTTQAMAEAIRLNSQYEQQIKAWRREGPSLKDKATIENYIQDHPNLLDTTPLTGVATGYTVQDMALEFLYENADQGHGNPPLSLANGIYMAAHNNGQFVPDTHLLSGIYDYYIQQRFKGKESNAEKYAIKTLIDFLGDRDLSTIKKFNIKEWIAHCSNKLKHKNSTIKRRMVVLNAMTNRYIDDLELDKVLSNPFRKHGLAGTHTGDEKLPFNADHLKVIDSYLKDSRISKRNKALITLMKHTGAGLTELANLEQADVFLQEEIPYIYIRPNLIRPNLKTSARKRRIPLPPKACTALKEFKKDTSSKCIWGDSVDTHSLSASLNKAIRAAGVPKSPRLTVNCFRHTLEQGMRDAGVADWDQKAILGHSKSDITAKYGSPAGDLKNLRTALTKAIKKLGNAPMDIYREDELAPQQNK